MFNFTDQLQNVFFIHIYDTDADKFGNTFIEQIKVDNIVEKLLPFKSLYLLVNASFRRRHVFFVRLLLATAPIVWAG